MPNIKFYPHKTQGKCKIYARIRIGATKDFRLSTGLTIMDAKDWNKKTNLPKPSKAENKNLKSSLDNLHNKIHSYILDLERDEERSLMDITSRSLKKLIAQFNNITEASDIDNLIPFSEHYYKSLKDRTYTKNGVKHAFKEKTISKYKNFARVLGLYESDLGRTIKLTDIDEKLCDDFLDWLVDQGKSVNTRGRFVKRLITITKDAERQGLKVNPGYKNLKGFEDETIVVYLNFEEIDKVIYTKMPTQRLEVAKDWFIISLFTALRISDLFRLTKNNIQIIDGGRYLCFKQYKTRRPMDIPTHHEVEKVLKKYNGGFPPLYSQNEKSQRSMLSTQIKKVCEFSGIDNVVEGRYNGVKGMYPKYKLISNHTGRRSFACNFYNKDNWSVQEIMNITGHESPKNFYKYIDRKDRTLSITARAKFDQLEIESNNQPKLKVI